jgi:hypothetical protein
MSENATAIEDCLCDAGFTGTAMDGCDPCMEYTYKPEPGNGSCLVCNQSTEIMATFCPDIPLDPIDESTSSSSTNPAIIYGAAGGGVVLLGAAANYMGWFNALFSTAQVFPTATPGGGQFSLESVKIL